MTDYIVHKKTLWRDCCGVHVMRWTGSLVKYCNVKCIPSYLSLLYNKKIIKFFCNISPSRFLLSVWLCIREGSGLPQKGGFSWRTSRHVVMIWTSNCITHTKAFVYKQGSLYWFSDCVRINKRRLLLAKCWAKRNSNNYPAQQSDPLFNSDKLRVWVIVYHRG